MVQVSSPSSHYDRSDMVVKTIRDSNQRRNDFFSVICTDLEVIGFEKTLRSVLICGKWRIFMKSIIS